MPKNHISLTSINDIQAICFPLFRFTKIDFLWYVRYYQDNSIISLSNNGYFQQSTVGNFSEYVADWEIITSTCNAHKSDQNPNRSVWLSKSILSRELFSMITKRYNIKSGIQIANRLNSCYELFWLGSSKKNLEQFYLDNIDTLSQFILYFKERGISLIDKSEDSKVIIPRRNDEFRKFSLNLAQKKNREKKHLNDLHKIIRTTNSPFDTNNQESLEKFCLFQKLSKFVETNHYHKECNKEKFKLPGTNILFTTKEANILYYLLRGKTSKKIGNIFYRSQKTIDTHIDNMKIKLSCRKGSRLIEKIWDLLDD